ncbi:hypothetical protein NQ314_003738 [Rhamnusium bicolor]|uniref:Uncharacterized protein n=1 Tax=Rhamnusium bicolor TaxID=1586634 RepID=A0AAV8ZNM8_9CUCU|nr:hypothetical protein NQ314_003738 [Rhamnusium bicolor]
MAITCCKCKTDIDNNENYFECDSCKRPVHINYSCSELSASEIKCMQLKKRILRFLCNECNNGLIQIPSLVRSIEELKTDIENLKLKYDKPFDGNHSVLQPKVNEIPSEDIISEMLERQKRANNIMISNLDETNSNTKDDLTSVKLILRDLNVDVDNIKVNRIGKPNQQRPRLEYELNSDSVPWYDYEIKCKAKERDLAYQAYNKNNNPTNWENYKVKRNIVVNLLKTKKRAILFSKD